MVLACRLLASCFKPLGDIIEFELIGLPPGAAAGTGKSFFMGVIDS